MTPFSYAKSRHVRALNPGPFRSYSRYKSHLREEFAKKCVYCRMPDTMKGTEGYGVDHYRPTSIFPQLETVYSNLFYCCNPCNSRKRDYWPSHGKVRTHFIPNPCDHEMFTHLRFAEARVLPRTDAGKVATELLDLNDPNVVEYRRFVLDLLAQNERIRIDTLRTLGELKRIRTGVDPPADVEKDIALLEKDLSQVERALQRLQGG